MLSLWLALFPHVMTSKKKDVKGDMSVFISVHLFVYPFESKMIDIESVMPLSVNCVTKKDSFHSFDNIREQQLVDQLYEILDYVCTSSLDEVENENKFDCDVFFDEAGKDENSDAEADE